MRVCACISMCVYIYTYTYIWMKSVFWQTKEGVGVVQYTNQHQYVCMYMYVWSVTKVVVGLGS